MGDALTRYRVDYKGGFATSDLTGFSSGVFVNFVTGDAYQRFVIGPFTRRPYKIGQAKKTVLERPVVKRFRQYRE